MLLATLLACAAEAPVEQPNVILYVTDTVRWDHSSLSGYAGDTTPSLQAFSELPGSTTFTHAFTTGAWSLPAYASLFTGQGVARHGVGFEHHALNPRQANLAEIFEAYGYATAGYASGPHLDPELGFSRGFAVYGHDISFLPASQYAEEALAWVDTQQQPFLLFLQGYDAHSPYAAPVVYSELFDPDGDRSRDRPCRVDATCRPVGQRHPERGGKPDLSAGPTDLEHERAHYDAAVLSGDIQLGRVLQGLDQRGLLADAVVLVLSDHGEFLEGNTARADDNLYHVPMVVRLPSDRPPARFEGLVSLADVLPTLLELLGMMPPAGMDGVSFREVLQPGATPYPGRDHLYAASTCCTFVREPEWELLVDRSGKQATELRRPGTSEDYAAEEPEVLARMLQHLEGWPADFDTPDQPRLPARPDLKEALQEGGYWGAPEN